MSRQRGLIRLKIALLFISAIYESFIAPLHIGSRWMAVLEWVMRLSWHTHIHFPFTHCAAAPDILFNLYLRRASTRHQYTIIFSPFFPWKRLIAKLVSKSCHYAWYFYRRGKAITLDYSFHTCYIYIMCSVLYYFRLPLRASCFGFAVVDLFPSRLLLMPFTPYAADEIPNYTWAFSELFRSAIFYDFDEPSLLIYTRPLLITFNYDASMLHYQLYLYNYYNI